MLTKAAAERKCNAQSVVAAQHTGQGGAGTQGEEGGRGGAQFLEFPSTCMRLDCMHGSLFSCDAPNVNL